MAFSRQEYWNGLPFPSPRDLPNPGIKPMSLGEFFTTEFPGKPIYIYIYSTFYRGRVDYKMEMNKVPVVGDKETGLCISVYKHM